MLPSADGQVVFHTRTILPSLFGHGEVGAEIHFHVACHVRHVAVELHTVASVSVLFLSRFQEWHLTSKTCALSRRDVVPYIHQPSCVWNCPLFECNRVLRALENPHLVAPTQEG